MLRSFSARTFVYVFQKLQIGGKKEISIQIYFTILRFLLSFVSVTEIKY